jgi:hypothetical protein
MTKLSDVQSILLVAASQRDTLSLLPTPATLTNVGARITKGLAALVTHGLAQERETEDAAAVYREEGDLLLGLFATPAGLAAIGVEPDMPAGAPTPAAAAPEKTEAAPPRPATKASLVLDLLRRPEGATLAELIALTGWLPHTTRAALTGLRKQGHAVARDQRDGVTCYRVAAAQ